MNDFDAHITSLYVDYFISCVYRYNRYVKTNNHHLVLTRTCRRLKAGWTTATASGDIAVLYVLNASAKRAVHISTTTLTI